MGNGYGQLYPYRLFSWTLLFYHCGEKRLSRIFILKDSLIDKEVIRLFKSGNVDKPYPISVKFGDMWGNSSLRNKDLFITTDFEGDFFTGRKEVLYLKNRNRTYTLEILGTVEATKHCGAYSELKEASVNGIRQADSITGKQIIKL